MIDLPMKSLFPSPAAGFDDPLEMLVACHERVRRNCLLVERIAGHLEDQGLDDEARVAAASVLRYFDIAGKNHHLDEEADLFPALLAVADATNRPGLQALVARLLDDHEALDALWADVRARLQALATGRPASLPPSLAAAFTRAYDEHIAEEEGVLIPLARRLLAAEALARLGASMAARRGAK